MARNAPHRAWLLSGLVFFAAIAAVASSPGLGAQDAQTATLKGRVPVLPRKAPLPAKDYGTKPSIKIAPADPPASAVWLGGGKPALDSANAPPARMEQRGFQFRPSLLVLQTGTPVAFPNEDAMYHSVFSFSEAKKFDLGRYRKGEEPAAVVFDKPGVVTLYCEIHEHMRATIIAVDTPWFAVTKPDGTFEISGIAPGTYTATIWLDPERALTKSVELKAGQTLDVDWSTESARTSP